MTIREVLGVELPVIQAQMAGVQGSALAVAVSNAGGLAAALALGADAVQVGTAYLLCPEATTGSSRPSGAPARAAAPRAGRRGS